MFGTAMFSLVQSSHGLFSDQRDVLLVFDLPDFEDFTTESSPLNPISSPRKPIGNAATSHTIENPQLCFADCQEEVLAKFAATSSGLHTL